MAHLTVLDPVAESTIVRQSRAPRLSSLAGKRIWFLDNQGQAWGDGPPRLNPLFQVWQERLARDYEIKWDYVTTQQFTSPFRHGKDKLEEIARGADAVVNGIACCGSGTSAVIHDAVQYELRGVPSVSLVTDSVAGHAKASTMKLGMTDLAVLVVSHNIHMFSPVATPEECARAAEDLYPSMVAALLGTAR